jgi:hypothetical protein
VHLVIKKSPFEKEKENKKKYLLDKKKKVPKKPKNC